MFTETIAYALYVAALTCFFSFGVQSLFYLWYALRKSDLIKKHKHVFQYYSGIIGDGLLIPLTNVFAVLTLDFLNQSLVDQSIWIWSVFGGFLITLFFHFYQQHYSLTNWTMPKIGQWNVLGMYHAVFMFCESSLLCYTLISFLNYISSNGLSFLITSPLKYSIFVLLIFLGTFLYDYRQTLKTVIRR